MKSLLTILALLAHLATPNTSASHLTVAGDRDTSGDSVSFAVAGDVMLARSVGSTFAKDDYEGLLSEFDDGVFQNVDVPFANLEGALSDQKFIPKAVLNNLIFIFPKNATDALKRLHLRAVSLANNHSLNGGVAGLTVARKLLFDNNITPFGDPRTSKEVDVVSFEGQGLKLYLIGVHALSKKSYSQTEIGAVIKKIKTDSKNRVIVFPHWGVEYATRHAPIQQELARQWIDVGADAVIGAHPHVVQDIEVYKNRPIVYSLGNFIFDQTFSKQTQRGLIVSGEFTDMGLDLSLLPVSMRAMRPSLTAGKEKQEVIQKLTAGLERYKKEGLPETVLHFSSQVE